MRSWRDRKEKADALLREHELGVLDGRSLDAAQVRHALAKRDALVATRLRALPNRVRALMAPAPGAVQRAVCAEVHRCVNELIRELAIGGGAA